MHIKSFIIGLCILCLGGSSFWWLNSEHARYEQQASELKLKYRSEANEYIKKYEQWMLVPLEERSELISDLNINANLTPIEILQTQQERLKADMDKLAAGNMTVYPFSDEYYGNNWEEKVQQYKKQKEWDEFLFTCSIVCISIGAIITGFIILLGIAKIIIKIIVKIKNKWFSSRKAETEQETVTDTIEDTSHEDHEDDHFNDLSNVLVNSGWQYAGSFGNENKSGLRQRKRIPAKNPPKVISEQETLEDSVSDKALTQKESSVKSLEGNDKTKEKTDSQKITGKDIDVNTTSENPHLIDHTLKDLTQQVSAIREYAANQQNRLERFQSGYDWNIIKTFCLRIIRCIDNLETRIERLQEDDSQTPYLEEVRDELIFALESSGIEQFEPEINSEYRGQEKIAEAVKEKTKNKDPELKGKIEKIIRPGYQFYIDDENIRVVRPAQVRLFA